MKLSHESLKEDKEIFKQSIVSAIQMGRDVSLSLEDVANAIVDALIGITEVEVLAHLLAAKAIAKTKLVNFNK